MSKKLVLAITGGGTEAIGAILSAGGASSYFLEGLVPYNNHSLARFINTIPQKFVSEQTARMMANAAYDRAEDLSIEDVRDLVGVGVTASLAKGNEREGREHTAFISVRTHDSLSVVRWDFKNPRTRQEEEFVLAGLIIKTINDYVPDSIPVDQTPFNYPGIRPSEFGMKKQAKDHYNIATMGKYNTILGKPIGKRPAIFPGSFNPMHEGHANIVKHMAEKLHKKVYLELGIGNVDKLTLDIIDVDERVNSIKKYMESDAEFDNACGGIILSTMPKFYEKLWVYNNPEFIVGADTAIRLFDSKYGESSFVGQKAHQMVDLCRMGEKPIFHVMPRLGYDFPAIDEEYQPFFNMVTDFEGSDISSTAIRASNGQTVSR